jgi:hypothetical protein
VHDFGRQTGELLADTFRRFRPHPIGMRVVGASHGADYRCGMPFAQVGSMSRSGAVPHRCVRPHCWRNSRLTYAAGDRPRGKSCDTQIRLFRVPHGIEQK